MLTFITLIFDTKPQLLLTSFNFWRFIKINLLTSFGKMYSINKSFFNIFDSEDYHKIPYLLSFKHDA